MRPALKPGLLPVWRNRETVQIGIDPRRAIALTGIRGTVGVLSLLDGSRDHAQVLAAAGDLGIPPETADRVITLLAAGGVLHDFPVGTYRAMPHGLRARLAPELAYGTADGGARVLARRQHACVRVHGMSRTGLLTASLLAAAGVGTVVSGALLPGPPVSRRRPATTAPPGGPPPRVPASQRPRGGSRRPDLVILADCHRREVPSRLSRDGIPHLATGAGEAIGTVGPLVLPGRTACLHCLDLTRAESDPAWPVILAQLATGGAEPAACDAVLAAAVAAQAAAQALTFVDRAGPASAVLNGTLELVLPGWQWRRRTWPPHPRCGCGRRGPS